MTILSRTERCQSECKFVRHSRVFPRQKPTRQNEFEKRRCNLHGFNQRIEKQTFHLGRKDSTEGLWVWIFEGVIFRKMVETIFWFGGSFQRCGFKPAPLKWPHPVKTILMVFRNLLHWFNWMILANFYPIEASLKAEELLNFRKYN